MITKEMIQVEAKKRFPITGGKSLLATYRDDVNEQRKKDFIAGCEWLQSQQEISTSSSRE